MLELRPHHLPFFVSFYNKGFDEYLLNLFINYNYGKKHTQEFVKLFMRMKHDPDLQVLIVDGPDYICSGCQNLKNRCAIDPPVDQDKIAEEVYGFHPETVIRVKDIVRIHNSIDENKYLHYKWLHSDPQASAHLKSKIPQEQPEKFSQSAQLINSKLFQ